jgi:hypothetical protein
MSVRVLKREPGSRGMVWVQALIDGGRLVRFVIADDADEGEVRDMARLVAERQREGLGFLDPQSPIPESTYEDRPTP